jgi:hypothetical protein
MCSACGWADIVMGWVLSLLLLLLLPEDTSKDL